VAKCLAKPDLALPEKRCCSYMHYVYILKSEINNDIYVGFSSDLKVRFQQHNSGKVKSTHAYKPWILVYYEAYLNKFDATRREKQLKNHAAKNILKTQVQNSINFGNDKIS